MNSKTSTKSKTRKPTKDVKVKQTFVIKVLSSRGKLLEDRTLHRNSQWSAHDACRIMINGKPVGTKITLSLNGKVIEEFVMHAEGWDYKVLNGASLVEASRATRKFAKSA